MLTLPKVSIESLNAQPIEWGKLPRRFLWPGELEVIVALIRSINARNVLEIGCNTGRTAKVILNNVASIEHYQGIDVLPGYTFAKPVQRREIPAQPGHLAADDPRFELLLRARGSFDLTEHDLRPADVVFIDGDHSAAAIYRDTQLARKLLRPGGIIIWHDYHDLGTVDVRDVLHIMSGAQRAEGGPTITHVEGTWLAFSESNKTAESFETAATS